MKITVRKMPESVIYILLWLLFLVIPFITNDYSGKDGLKKILYDWLRVLPFFIVFAVNNFILLRLLLFRGRTVMYVTLLVAVISAVSVSFHLLSPVIHKNDPKTTEMKILQDPQFGREEMQLGKQTPVTGNIPVSPEIFNQGIENSEPRNRRVPAEQPPLLLFLNTLVISLLIAGFNTAIAVTNRWFTEEQARKEIEKEHIESKLAFLQNQVNPHFLMNTLNNIHSLIEFDQSMAQGAVLKLSGMMRYLLYESGRGSTSLLKEIDFMKAYLELMSLRVDKSIDVKLELPEKVNNVNIPPLLFITFIENAFKHGVSYREPSSISFILVQNRNSLEFISENTIPRYGNIDSNTRHGGFGLENIRKRLDMIYGDRYRLETGKTGSRFRARLVIPV